MPDPYDPGDDPIRVGPSCPHGDYETFCPACVKEIAEALVRLTEMQKRIEALKRGVRYRLNAGKKNMIVDLDVLAALLDISE